MKYTYKYHVNKNLTSASEAPLTDKEQSFVKALYVYL